MQPQAYIHDGYTRRGYVPEEPRLYPAVRFAYRPVLAANRSLIFHKAEKLRADEADKLAAQTLENHLAVWDVRDHDGKEVPILAQHILRLEPTLFVKLYKLVMGVVVTDEDPEWSPLESQQVAERALARAISGTGPDEEEAVDLGNSVTG